MYIPLQDHQYALPDCPLPTSPTLRDPTLGMTGAGWPANPFLKRPRPRVPRQRRRAPSPPRPRPPRVRSSSRSPYAPPRQRESPQRQEQQQQQQPSTFRNHTFPIARARNLFQDFVAALPRPIPTPAPAPSPRTRSPSLDVFLELNAHTRHPLDLRNHLTILPSWAIKAEKESQGECIICYGEDKHLQIKCKSCGTMKVC